MPLEVADGDAGIAKSTNGVRITITRIVALTDHLDRFVENWLYCVLVTAGQSIPQVLLLTLGSGKVSCLLARLRLDERPHLIRLIALRALTLP